MHRSPTLTLARLVAVQGGRRHQQRSGATYPGTWARDRGERQRAECRGASQLGSTRRAPCPAISFSASHSAPHTRRAAACTIPSAARHATGVARRVRPRYACLPVAGATCRDRGRCGERPFCPTSLASQTPDLHLSSLHHSRVVSENGGGEGCVHQHVLQHRPPACPHVCLLPRQPPRRGRHCRDRVWQLDLPALPGRLLRPGATHQGRRQLLHRLLQLQRLPQEGQAGSE